MWQVMEHLDWEEVEKVGRECWAVLFHEYGYSQHPTWSITPFGEACNETLQPTVHAVWVFLQEIQKPTCPKTRTIQQNNRFQILQNPELMSTDLSAHGLSFENGLPRLLQGLTMRSDLQVLVAIRNMRTLSMMILLGQDLQYKLPFLLTILCYFRLSERKVNFQLFWLVIWAGSHLSSPFPVEFALILTKKIRTMKQVQRW